MAKAYKILGQAAPAADTDTTLYTVPVGKSAVISSIVVANRDTTGVVGAFRIAVIPSGGALSAQHYLDYDKAIDSKEAISRLQGITLAAGDKIVVRGSTANLSFNTFGSEIG